MNYQIITYGCQMNVCDSDWLARSFQSMGWQESDEDRARLFLVNTCSVREKPEQKVYSLLGRIKEHWEKDPKVFAAVGGCVAQQVGTKLWERFPFVRLIFGTDGVSMVPQALEKLADQPTMRTSLLDFVDYYPEREVSLPEDQVSVSAFVNIMQGCDNFCAYCIVPYVRGRQKSRKSQEILKECRALVDKGVREITLLGQNVNSYGLDSQGDGIGFAELLSKVSALPGLERIRFTTSHPKDLAPEVIKAFGTLPNLCPQLHLPMQSGSDAVLKAMGRKYTRHNYLEKIRSLREHCPEIVLTTDFIVGFPGETEEDFQATLELMREVGFDNSFSFKYCDRPGVKASLLKDKVDEETKSSRLMILQDLQKELTTASLAHQVSQETEVLIEGRSKRDAKGLPTWQGRDRGGRTVNCTTNVDLDLTNSLVHVLIQEAKKHSLFGNVVGEPW